MKLIYEVKVKFIFLKSVVLRIELLQQTQLTLIFSSFFLWLRKDEKKTEQSFISEISIEIYSFSF